MQFDAGQLRSNAVEGGDGHTATAKDLASDLPIAEIIDPITSSLQDRNNLVLQAPPGAGKTTVVPLALLLSKPAWLAESQRILVNITGAMSCFQRVTLHTIYDKGSQAQVDCPLLDALDEFNLRSFSRGFLCSV